MASTPSVSRFPGALSGANQAAEHLKRRLGIGFGETTADGQFTLKEGECLGACGDAPVLLVFCGDMRRGQRVCELRGHTHAQNTLDSFMNAAVDAALAMQAMILASEAAGLGCCCISQVRKRLPQVADLLGLPDGVFPIAGFAAGWRGEARDVTRRLPPSVVVHRDAYDDSDLAAGIDQYDQARHAARPLGNQINPEKFGTADFYGWSENAARRLAEPSDLGGLRAFLESHGFDLA